MPLPVADVDRRYAADWSKWPVPEMPDVTVEPWAELDPFWRERVDERPVDHERTRALVDVDLPLRIGAGAAPWLGASYGSPFQLVDMTGPTTPVWDKSKPMTWRGFTPVPPIVNLPLPGLVRREGDPAGAFDLHWVGWDEHHDVLLEVITLRYSQWNRLQTFGRCDWVCGYAGGGGVARWDTSRPWNAPGQPRGVVAAGFPKFPLIVRWDEIERGRIDHALFLAVPNYAPARVGGARGFDGDWVGHPLRAGETLRLRLEVVARFAPGSPARIIAQAMHEHGVVLGDRTNPAKGVRTGIASVALTQDRRWAAGDEAHGPLGDMDLHLTDFEVVAA